MIRMPKQIWLVAVTIISMSFAASTTRAIPPLFEQFAAKYVGENPTTDEEKAFAESVKTTKCNICHMGNSKKERNRFGAELAKLLKKDELKPKLENAPEDAKKEIHAAFDEVAELPYDAATENSPTFGQVLSLKRLPGDDHDITELIAAVAPKAEPAEAKTAEGEASQISGSTGELLNALLSQLKSDLKSELVVEITTVLKEQIAAQLKSEMPDAVRAGIRAIRQEEALAELYAQEGEAIEKIEEIGGTVREIALNDDRKEVDFHLSGKELTDEGLSYVRYIEKMITLHLKHTKVTDAGMIHLSGLPSLEKLHLEETALTDAGLEHLKDIPNLSWLNIYGTEVTDAGIEQLKHLTNLKKLYIWQTKITIPGFQELQAAMPNTTIIPDLVQEKQRTEDEAKRKAEEEKKKAEEEKKKAEEEKQKAEEEKPEEEAKENADEESKTDTQEEPE